jgi:predicted permease
MFRSFREQSLTLAGTLASSGLRMNVEVGNQIDPTVAGQMVSGSYYAVLGVPAALGRLIQPEDDGAAGTGAVAVLSYGYWQRRFGGDPSILGTVVRLNGVPFTIIGVSAPEFFGTHVGASIDVSVPLSMQPQLMSEMPEGRISGRGADDFWLELIGRLNAGVPASQAQAEMNTAFQPIIQGLMGPRSKITGHPQLALEPGGRGLSELRQRFSKPLLVLMAAVALVLLIACANVAHLLLARAATRRREMAVRVSLGAGRGRIVRQLLTESLLLSTLGGGLGLLFAVWSSRTLAGLLADGNAYALAARPDARVLLFTLAVSVATGVIFGLAPAFGASRIDTNTALKDGARQVISGGRFGVRGWLVAAQVAISVVLLVGAGLFVRTLMNLRHLDLGIDQEHVLMLRLEPRGSNQKRQNEPRLRQIYGELLARIETVPGIRAASLSGATPLSNENTFGAAITVPGYVPQSGENMRIDMKQVYPGYFAALGIPMLARRDLGESNNRAEAPTVAVINETMAQRFFGSPASAIGRTFRDGAQQVEIVGVAGNTRDRALREAGLPMAHETFAKAPTGRGQMTLLVRAAGDPQTLSSTIRQLARETDPTMPMLDVQTVEDRVQAASRQEQLVALLSAIFGAIALALAAIGLYGVLAYGVLRRQPEFGVRLALGASPRGLVHLVLGESCMLVGAGLLAGLAAAGAAAGSISRMLFGLAPLDPISFAAASAALLTVALLAAWVPARHASRVDPIVALRQE